MNLNDLKGSDSFRKLNPDLFVLGGLQGAKPQRQPGSALDQGGQAPQGGEESVVGCRVTFIVFGRRPLDLDNLVGGCKHLRDAIAAWIGRDDSERFITWDYALKVTEGKEGVAVKIELETKL